MCGRCLREAPDGVRITADVSACPECIEKTESQLDNMRPIFEAMITGGVDRKIANDVMSAYMDSLQSRLQ